MAKANAIMKYSRTGLAMQRVHCFEVIGAGTATLAESDIHPDLIPEFLSHGVKQKVSDKGAIGAKEKITPAERLERLQAICQHFSSGSSDWGMARTGGGGPTLDTTLLIRALQELYPKSTSVEERVKGWTAKERLAAALSEKVAPIIERLKSEVTEDIDTDDLLEGLE